MRPLVRCFFDEVTNTACYVVADSATGKGAIVDPVLSYDPDSDRCSAEALQPLCRFVRDQGLHIEWILETHIHADHLSGGQFVKQKLGGRIGIGQQVTRVRETLLDLYGDGVEATRPAFDVLFADGEEFQIGSIAGRVLSTPGHTPACVTYLVGDACFVGDTLFMPDSGTARCDFPDGDAQQLYASIQRIFELPGEYRLFVCHDYGANGQRDFEWETTVGEQREHNIHVGGGALEHDFVAMRNARDKTLALPRLFLPSIRSNMFGGRRPSDLSAT